MATWWRAIIGVCVVLCTAATWAGVDISSATPLKRVIGTGKPNVLLGTAQADFIDGRAGDDTLYGLAGNDGLVGGVGADRIFCGRGRDTVFADRRDTVARDCEVVKGTTPPQPTPPPPSAIPLQLLGVWNRNITDGAIIGDSHRGIWSLSFSREGILVVFEPVGAHVPGVRDTITSTVEANADGQLLVSAGPGCSVQGVFHWQIVGDVLRIELVADICPARVHVLVGDWSR